MFEFQIETCLYISASHSIKGKGTIFFVKNRVSCFARGRKYLVPHQYAAFYGYMGYAPHNYYPS